MGSVGKASAESGEFDMTSWNISPDTIVATPTSPGTVFDVSLLDNYDTFNVAQTGAATDIISLPASIPVGTVMRFIAASAIDVESEASSGIGINGGTDAQDVGITAGSYLELRKVTATNWVANQYTSAGAVTAPTPG